MFVVDETKKPVAAPHRTLIVFCGVLAASGDILDLMDDLHGIRSQLPEIDRDRSLKSSDLWKRKPDSDDWIVVPEYRPYAERIAQFYKNAARIHCVATTEQHLAATDARMTFRDEEGRLVANRGVLTGPHSVPFVTWLKYVARTENFGSGTFFVLVDASGGSALRAGYCFRLGDLYKDVASTAADGGTEVGVDIFVSGDHDPAFRDALMAPDFLGNLALAKLEGRAPRLVRGSSGGRIGEGSFASCLGIRPSEVA